MDYQQPPEFDRGKGKKTTYGSSFVTEWWSFNEGKVVKKQRSPMKPLSIFGHGDEGMRKMNSLSYLLLSHVCSKMKTIHTPRGIRLCEGLVEDFMMR